MEREEDSYGRKLNMPGGAKPRDFRINLKFWGGKESAGGKGREGRERTLFTL